MAINILYYRWGRRGICLISSIGIRAGVYEGSVRESREVLFHFPWGMAVIRIQTEVFFMGIGFETLIKPRDRRILFPTVTCPLLTTQ